MIQSRLHIPTLSLDPTTSFPALSALQSRTRVRVSACTGLKPYCSCPSSFMRRIRLPSVHGNAPPSGVCPPSPLGPIPAGTKRYLRDTVSLPRHVWPLEAPGARLLSLELQPASRRSACHGRRSLPCVPPSGDKASLPETTAPPRPLKTQHFVPRAPLQGRRMLLWPKRFDL